MEVDPFGHAIRDHYRGERTEPLIDRDGAETREHTIDDWYFDEYQHDEWFESWIDGPVLDMGAGVGRETLYFQDYFETIAIEVSSSLVETMRERGVKDARLGNMFTLREQFERDRFRSAFALGTQVQLAGSMQSLRRFLGDLAFVTTPDATAVLHGYAPEQEVTSDIFAYRADPTPGIAYRIYHCEYNGETGRTLFFQLFSIDRLQEATVGTTWNVAEASYGQSEPPDEANTWLAALTKE